MPLVRIDLMEGRTDAYREQIGEIVQQAMIDCLKVPKDDRFQVISQHAKNGLGSIPIISASGGRTTASFCRSR